MWADAYFFFLWWAVRADEYAWWNNLEEKQDKGLGLQILYAKERIENKFRKIKNNVSMLEGKNRK